MQNEINNLLEVEEGSEIKPVTEKIIKIRRTSVLISLTRAIIDTHNSNLERETPNKRLRETEYEQLKTEEKN